MRAAVGVAAMILALTGCAASGGAGPASTAPPTVAAPATAAASPPPVEITPLPEGVAPARVVIPTLGLDEPLVALGLNPDASMQVPEDFDAVGWFTGGGRPGGRGPTVIAGHVDSPTGPAVFLRLNELQPGDPIDVVDETGTLHRYVVAETADYPKSAFPTARVFGATATDELRLITCGGVFDPDAASYVDNRVVYAVRAPA